MNVYQAINAKLKGTHTKIRKGRGYLYFTFDDGKRFDTTSIYWDSADQKDIAYLVKEGREFADRIANRGY